MPVSRQRRRSGLGCLATLAIVAAVLLTALFLAVRTRGACELLADYVSEKIGVRMSIGSARIALPCDLVLEDLASRSPAAGGGMLRVRSAWVGLRLNGDMPVRIEEAQLDLVRDAAGAWQSPAFEQVATLADVRQTQGIFAPMPKRLRLDIRDSGIRWRNANGSDVAAVEGLDFRIIPLDVFGRPIWYYEAFAKTVRRPGGGEGKAIRRQWVGTEANPYVQIVYTGVWSEGKTQGRDWWSVPAEDESGRQK